MYDARAMHAAPTRARLQTTSPDYLVFECINGARIRLFYKQTTKQSRKKNHQHQRQRILCAPSLFYFIARFRSCIPYIKVKKQKKIWFPFQTDCIIQSKKKKQRTKRNENSAAQRSKEMASYLSCKWKNHSVRAFNSRLHSEEFNSALGKMENCWWNDEMKNAKNGKLQISPLFFSPAVAIRPLCKYWIKSIRSADALIFRCFRPQSFSIFISLFCVCVCEFVKLIKQYQCILRNGREPHFITKYFQLGMTKCVQGFIENSRYLLNSDSGKLLDRIFYVRKCKSQLNGEKRCISM